MVIRLLLGLLVLFILFGCVNSRSVDETVSAQSHPVQTKTLPPPDLEMYGSTDDVIVLHRYATDLNWYMFYLFSYTHVVNQYARTKGWIPPDTEPLCKTFKYPRLEELPKFEFKPDGNFGQLELELTLYIQKLKEAYKNETLKFQESELWQQRLCLY